MYQAEMEQWKEVLRAAGDQVSVGALSNSRFHIVSQFSVNHFTDNSNILYCRVSMLKVTILEKSYKIVCFGEQYAVVKEDMRL